jgi:hypothetical protein
VEREGMRMELLLKSSQKVILFYAETVKQKTHLKN